MGSGTKDTVKFHPSEPILVRAPLLPASALAEVSDEGAEKSLDSIVRFFEVDTAANSALITGSYSLATSLKRLPSDLKKRDKIAEKLRRYAKRMTTRATPFGALAGVMFAKWSQHTDLDVGYPDLRARPDMEWLCKMLCQIEENARILDVLRFRSNPAIYERDGRFYIPERARIDNSKSRPPISIRATNVVRHLIDLASDSQDLEEIQKGMMSLQGADRTRIRELVRRLWNESFLVADLRPPTTSVDPCQYIVDKLEGKADLGAWSGRLISLRNAIQRLSSPDDVDFADSYAEIRKTNYMDEAADTQTELQCDLAWRSSGDEISKKVGVEAAKAARALLLLSPSPFGSSRIAGYRDRFVSKYGPGREVPLLEMLDEHLGIGPLSKHTVSPQQIPASRQSRRRQILQSLAFRHLNSVERVLKLDEELISQIAVGELSRSNVPASLEIYCSIDSDSQTAIDSGDFKLVVGPAVGAVPAGRSIGRFLYLFPDEIPKQKIRLHSRNEPEVVHAEVVYLPHRLRTANVTIRPMLWDYEIPFGAYSQLPDQNVIRLQDLLVGVSNDRFYLRWRFRDKCVVPHANHMLTTFDAPSPVEFLAELCRENVSQLSPFDWGSASGFPFLPRVEFGKSVLRLAEWNINSYDCDRLTRDRGDFVELFSVWKKAWEVPNCVYLVQGDNRLLLDLSSEFDLSSLASEVSKIGGGNSLTLQEVLPLPERSWVQGPRGKHVSEFVIPIVTNAKPTSVTLNSPLVASTNTESVDQRLKPLGSEWLFAKIYCSEDAHNRILTHPITQFLFERQAAIDQWFFMRYRDPVNHIRLRLKGRPEVLLSEMLPHLASLLQNLLRTREISNFAFDAYERELERYGGLHHIDFAESVFSIDSRFVLELLSLLQSHGQDAVPDQVAVASANNFLTSIGLDSQTKSTFFRTQYKQLRKQFSKEFRDERALLKEAVLANEFQLGQEFGDAFKRLCDEQCRAMASIGPSPFWQTQSLTCSRDSILASLLHMHFNRLIGISPQSEQRLVSFLSRTIESLLHFR